MTAEDVKRFVERNIEPGSTIRTDGFASYDVLETTGRRREKAAS